MTGESETSASLLARYDDEIGIIARYAPVQPCLSAYIPVYMVGALPERMQNADKIFDEKSLWWQVKLLSLLVTVDENAFAENVRENLRKLEKQFEMKAEKAEKTAKELIKDGEREKANAVLLSVTEECTDILFDFASNESKRLANIIKNSGGLYGRQKEAIEKYFEYSGISAL